MKMSSISSNKTKFFSVINVNVSIGLAPDTIRKRKILTFPSDRFGIVSFVIIS